MPLTEGPDPAPQEPAGTSSAESPVWPMPPEWPMPKANPHQETTGPQETTGRRDRDLIPAHENQRPEHTQAVNETLSQQAPGLPRESLAPRTPYDQEVARQTARARAILTKHGIATPESLEQQIRANTTEVSGYIHPRGKERLLRMGYPVLGLLSKAAKIATLGNFDLDHAAKEIAQEAVQYQAATGKDPNLGIASTLVYSGIELFLTATEIGGALVTAALGAIPTLGGSVVGSAIGGMAADAAIDTGMGKIIEWIKYPHRTLFGETVHHKSTNTAVWVSGLIPVLPVAPTVFLMQSYGRHLLRKDLGQHPLRVSAEAQTAFAQAATLLTLRQIKDSQSRRKGKV